MTTPEHFPVTLHTGTAFCESSRHRSRYCHPQTALFPTVDHWGHIVGQFVSADGRARNFRWTNSDPSKFYTPSHFLSQDEAKARARRPTS